MDFSKLINIGGLKDKCIGVYKNIAQSDFGIGLDNLYHKVDTNVRTGIMNTLGKDMYDYSQIEGITEFSTYEKKRRSLREFLKSYSSENFDQNETLLRNNKFFVEMVQGEKIILFGNYFSSNAGKLDERYLLTNYGRFLSLTSNCNNSHLQCWSVYKDFNFWIPIDYIFIMQSFCSENKTIQGKIIMELIEHFKTYLYDRKVVTLTSAELVEENKLLREKYARYQEDNERLQKEIKEFNEEREKFNKETRPYVDIKIDREKLEEDRAKLKLAAAKLTADKQKVDEFTKKMNDVNINELLS